MPIPSSINSITSTVFVSNHELLLCNIMAIYCTSCPLFILLLVFTLLVLLQVALKSPANQLYSAVNTAHSVAMHSLSTWAPDLPWAPLGRSKHPFCVRSWKRKSIPLWKEITSHRERKTGLGTQSRLLKTPYLVPHLINGILLQLCRITKLHSVL